MTYSLQHHKDMVKEVGEATRQVRPLLLIVKEDLRGMSEAGMPVNFIMSKLNEIGITCRPETLRRFLSDEFPEAYSHFYQRKPRHERAPTPSFQSSQPVARPSSNDTHATEEAPSPTSGDNRPEAETSPRKRQTQKLDIGEMTQSVESYRKGEHLKKDRKGD